VLVLPLPLSLHQSVDQLAKPEGHLHPCPPKNAEHDSYRDEVVQDLRRRDDLDKEESREEQREEEQGTSHEGHEEKDNDPCFERDFRLWGAEIATAALRAHLADTGVHMQPRTELDVVAASAEVAEYRFPGRHSVAVVAIFHRSLTRASAARHPSGGARWTTRNHREKLNRPW
jgi:hypothetical protein